MNLNAVFDTNVLISSILWRGIPFQLLRWAEEGSLRIYTSLEILAEIHRVLHYPKFQQYIDSQQASPGELFCKNCIVVHHYSGRSDREGRMF